MEFHGCRVHGILIAPDAPRPIGGWPTHSNVQLLAKPRSRLPHSPRFSASGYHGLMHLGASHLTLCNSTHPQLRLLRFVDQHRSPLSQRVMTVTAPVPLFRRQTADNGIGRVADISRRGLKTRGGAPLLAFEKWPSTAVARRL